MTTPSRLLSADREREAAITAIVRRYGRHFDDCGVWRTGAPGSEPDDPRCDCGLRAALSSPETTPAPDAGMKRDASEQAIHRRDQHWAQAEFDGMDEHPDTQCSADLDRHDLLESRAALSSLPPPDAGLLAALDTLVRAVGDYKWLLNGRDKTGRCTLGCELVEGQYHAEDCPAGVLSIAYLEAVAALAATPPAAVLQKDGLDVERLGKAIDANGIIRPDDPYFCETVSEIAAEYDRLGGSA